MAVAECRHFTKASERLYVSQSALSQQITKLENDLGVKLINRLSHPIELTEAGYDFAKHAAKIICDVNILQQNMQQWHRQEHETLRIGMITGLGTLNLADILACFNTAHHNIKLILSTRLSKILCSQLANNDLDLAIFAAPRNISQYDFATISLQQEPFVAILPAGHKLAVQPSLDLATASQERFIFPTDDNVSHDLFLSACQNCGFTPNIVSYAHDPGRRLDLVEAGLGISLISQSGLSYYPQRKNVIAKPLKTPIYKHIVLAKRRNSDAFPALQAFWSYVQQYTHNAQ